MLFRTNTDSHLAKLTNVEKTFADDEIIVSKTDVKGMITYANDIFLSISGYSEKEVLGKPHNLIRHPDMPKCIFKLAWDRIKSGEEIFAYVVNRCKNGDHYWVLAHMTPSFDNSGRVVGFHSNRRRPKPTAIDKIGSIYQELCEIETRNGSPRAGMLASYDHLTETLNQEGVSYDQYIFSL